MTSATIDPSQPAQPDDGIPPPLATIHISPSQRMEQLPIAALLAFVPRLRTTYRILTSPNVPIATSRTYYQLRLATGNLLDVSDNLLDLIRLIDGRHNIQAISDALAVKQERPVHPAEIVHLLRTRLSPAGLVELSFPPALPQPQQTSPLWSLALAAIPTEEARAVSSSSAPPSALTPVEYRSLVSPPASRIDPQWAPPGKRSERLRAKRRTPLLGQQTRLFPASVRLAASVLIVLAAGSAFLLGHASFSHTSFTLPSLSALFGSITPTLTVGPTITPTPTPPPKPIHYAVQDADSLEKIATHFHETVAALMLVNNLSSPDAIYPGQLLIIPTFYHPGEAPTSVALPAFYVVQHGDNLYTIAQLFGTTQDVLARYNHIPTNQVALIHPGDTLVIPTPSAVPPQT